MNDNEFENFLAGANPQRGGLVHWKLLDSYDIVDKMLHEVFGWRNESIAGLAEPTDTTPDLENEKHDLAFKAAACSAVAVGAITPLVDTLITIIEKKWSNRRKEIKAATQKTHKSRSSGKIRQRLQKLLASLDVSESVLNDDLWKRLDAIYAYRDTALHNGYEWPKATVKTFNNIICDDNNKWNTLFSVATINKAPCIITMKDSFIKDALDDVTTLASVFRDIDRGPG